MKSVVLALGAVVVLGCAGQPSSRSVSPRNTVFDELAAVVDQALAAKSVEEDRLAQYGVEKQRLVSRLMPNGDWADGHPLAIEGYVSERDPESAKNLCVVLEKMAESGKGRASKVPGRLQSWRTTFKIPISSYQSSFTVRRIGTR
jgi:hypothetical protein